ncbi:hypothetical protein O181_122572 [Austropuccinia psidii MF-1]|uniref:Uncharacterized protein n=1 Tax=Austropuccinia psidii MF-1 TaxID=1389203 RepID=A0A9Q3KNC5_9BASI|nr:hypothetical protein [Austropuccinia psidii MF-1]
MPSKVLTHCQACWAEFLSEFHFTITYRPGRLAPLPDALSHRDNMYPERGVDFISKNPQNFHQVIKQDGIQESRFFSIKVEIFSDLVGKIQKEVLKDNDYKEILKKLARGESVTDYSLELSQPQRLTLLHGCCGNYNLEPSWGQLATPYLLCQIGPLWCSMAILPFMALDPILPSLASLANSHITNPQAFIFDFGTGGSFSLPGGSGPLAIIFGFGPPPFIRGVRPKWPFWAI